MSITRVDVKLVSPKVDLLTGLARPLTLAWVANAIDSSVAREQISRDVPVDGVEVVEWMQWCLPSGHLVVTAEGFKDISEIVVGNKVLTHNGSFETVTRVFKRPYSGKLVGLKLVGYPDTIWLTPEHPVLIGVRELKGSGYRKREWSVWWVKAGDIIAPMEKVMGGAYKRRLYALLPVPKTGNRMVKPTKALARFIGYYLSEGCTYHSKKYHRYGIQLANTDTEIIEDMIKCIKEAFGKDPNIVEDERGVKDVVFYSKDVYLWLKENFGINCYNKQVPSWLLSWPIEYIRELLNAYWLGDGSSQPRRGYDRIAYYTVSKKLALGLRLLELRLGRETTIHRRSNPSAYVVYVNNPNSREGYPEVRFMDEYLWMPIKNIEISDYDGYVYNFEVENSNSYVVETMAVHNCASDNAVLEAMELEYNRLGSQVLTGSDDAYIPGVRVGDLRGESVRGEVVSRRGYGIVKTPYGDFRVQVRGKTTIATRDLLAWATIPWSSYLQWVLTLIQWRDLATLPVRQRVRFASSNGLVAPQFFLYAARLPLPLVTFRIRITSDREQEITLRGRGTRGSYETVVYETKFKVESGENEVLCNVVGIPFVQSHTVEIQPSDNTQTVLDSFEVFPPI